MFNKLTLLAAALLFIFACKKTAKDLPADTLFTEMPASVTGVDFANQLEFRQDFNIYTYRNFYNGGGVAIGDVNNDGLSDLYFTANMGKNRLYLNRGNWQFEDVTEKAGVAGTRQWSTGVAMADVNGDGLLDIYVCNSGDVKGDNRENELFINQGASSEAGTPIFKEQAKEYGLADPGLSTHAAFFDYDKDGDLDMYLLNNSFRSIGSFDLRKNERNKRDPLGGHKLFRNDSPSPGATPLEGGRGVTGAFTDVSEQAGIYGSIIGFGLGVTVGDVDKDGWQDIYVSNDFFERDYLYMNNQDGTFREVLPESMGSISAASMGADLADINNDALPDLFVTEMLPETEARLKTKTTFDSWNRYREAESSGYHHQFTRNMLQVNMGNWDIERLGYSAPGNTTISEYPNIPLFAEVGRFARVEATDWSWGALIQDFNNDGWKDIFVANGIYQDLTDQDFLQFVASDEVKKSIISREGVDFKKLVDFIPSEPVPNYCFMGQGDLKFVNSAKEWGLAKPGFSNGSAYGDLDNDGDLDLVVNNLNSPASIFRNNGEQLFPENHWLSVTLKGEGSNTFAVGAKLTAKVKGKIFYLEHNPIRGFESSMDYRSHFGLGDAQVVDTLLVEWYYGKTTLMTNVPTNQFLTLHEKEAQAPPPTPKGELNSARRQASELLLQNITASLKLDFRHQENLFVDFDRDRLVYHMISTESPKMAVGDVNGDGRDDFFIGNAKDSPGALFVQTAGGFSKTNQAIFEADKASEDMGCVFFDADGDRDLDLYVASGGNEFSSSSSALASRLYLNDGRGNFSKSPQLLPAGKFESTSCVVPADFDGDGDQDLFVGVRLIPFYYGVPGNGYLLQNDGKGNFKNIAPQAARDFKELGMMTDACWFDADGDKDLDLAVAGEWMPIVLFTNENGRFVKSELTPPGWWNCLEVTDLNGDGKPDLVAGNHGLNSRFRASMEKPVTCHVNDFDKNGTVEQILCQYNGDKSYPMALRHDLVSQMPWLKKKYLKFASYKEQTFEDIFTPEQRQGTLTLEAKRLETSVLLNQGGGKFEVADLPQAAQLSPVYAILPGDFDGDGKTDLLLGGNLFNVKPEAGRYDASYGCFLKGTGDGQFEALPMQRSGLFVEGEVRDFAVLKKGNARLLVVARNDAAPLFFQVKSSKQQ